MIQEVEQLRPQVACEAMMFAGAQCASTSAQALLKEGSKHLGGDRAAGNGNDRWPYFSDASCVESGSGGLFVIEYVSSTPLKRPERLNELRFLICMLSTTGFSPRT